MTNIMYYISIILYQARVEEINVQKIRYIVFPLFMQQRSLYKVENQYTYRSLQSGKLNHKVSLLMQVKLDYWSLGVTLKD